MAALIDWATPLAALDAALVGAQQTDVIVGNDVRARLEAYGLIYDQQNALYRTQMTADEAQYAADLATWAATLSGAGKFFTECDRVLRYVEGVAIEAQTGAVIDPTIAVLNDGTRYVLAPDALAALPFDDNDVDIVTAERVLNDSSVPVLRVRALETGAGGNRVRIQVADASDGVADHFKLRAELGGHAWERDNLDLTGEAVATVDAGLLIEVEQVGRGRPDNAALSALTGGVGRALVALQERAARAKLLASTTRVQKAAIDRWLQRATDAWAAKPTYTSPLAQREADLGAVIAEAVEFIAYLAR